MPTHSPYNNLSVAELDEIEQRLRYAPYPSATHTDLVRLLSEVRRLRLALALLRCEYANLLAAARATIAASRDGEADPLGYLHDELDAHGQLPAPDAHPAQLLALAMALAGQPGAGPTPSTAA